MLYTSTLAASYTAWKSIPSCNGDSGSTSSTATPHDAASASSTTTSGAASTTTPSGSSSRAAPASAATVRWVNTSRGVNASPAARARATSWIAMIESPPSSKNPSSTPTRATPRTSPNNAHNTRSRGEDGARNRPPVNSGTGRPRRSSLPLTVNGNPSSTTTAAGTMYSANRDPTAARTAPASSTTPATATTYPTSRLTPGWSSRTTTTACATPAHAASAASTSPNSTRNPRTFT